jgi:hypothetical protein
MTRSRTTAAALLAGALACACLAGRAATGGATDAVAATHTSTSPDQPKPRRGGYEIESEGPDFTHARCAEGGNVVVATHPGKPLVGGGPAPSREGAILAACKTIDYTK